MHIHAQGPTCCGDEQEVTLLHPALGLNTQWAGKQAGQGDPTPRTAAVLLVTPDRDSRLSQSPDCNLTGCKPLGASRSPAACPALRLSLPSG